MTRLFQLLWRRRDACQIIRVRVGWVLRLCRPSKHRTVCACILKPVNEGVTIGKGNACGMVMIPGGIINQNAASAAYRRNSQRAIVNGKIILLHEHEGARGAGGSEGGHFAIRQVRLLSGSPGSGQPFTSHRRAEGTSGGRIKFATARPQSA